MNFKQICTELIRQSQPDKGQSMERFLKHRFKFLGVPASERRRISNEHFEDEEKDAPIDWEYVEACWDQLYREFQYLALDYLHHKAEFFEENDIYNLRRLAQEKPGWDISDNLGQLVAKLVIQHPGAKHHLIDWAEHDDPSVRRIAIVHQVHMKEYTDEKLLGEILDRSLEVTDPLVKKAMVWALREYSKTNPEWVEDYLWQNGDHFTAAQKKDASQHLPEKKEKKDKKS